MEQRRLEARTAFGAGVGEGQVQHQQRLALVEVGHEQLQSIAQPLLDEPGLQAALGLVLQQFAQHLQRLGQGGRLALQGESQPAARRAGRHMRRLWLTSGSNAGAGRRAHRRAANPRALREPRELVQ